MTAINKKLLALQILKPLKLTNKQIEDVLQSLKENTSQSANVRPRVGAKADSRKAQLKSLYQIKVNNLK